MKWSHVSDGLSVFWVYLHGGWTFIDLFESSGHSKRVTTSCRRSHADGGGATFDKIASEPVAIMIVYPPANTWTHRNATQCNLCTFSVGRAADVNCSVTMEHHQDVSSTVRETVWGFLEVLEGLIVFLHFCLFWEWLFWQLWAGFSLHRENVGAPKPFSRTPMTNPERLRQKKVFLGAPKTHFDPGKTLMTWYSTNNFFTGRADDLYQWKGQQSFNSFSRYQ